MREQSPTEDLNAPEKGSIVCHYLQGHVQHIKRLCEQLAQMFTFSFPLTGRRFCKEDQ